MKKDFQLIAKALRFAQPSKIANATGYKQRNIGWRNSVECIADELERNYQNFDRDKFEKECNFIK